MRYAIKMLSEGDVECWDKFVASHALGRSIVTSAARQWYEIHGWSPRQIAAFDGGGIVGGLGVLTKKVPFLRRTLARISAILVPDADVDGATTVLMQAAESYARSARAIEVETHLHVPDRHAIDGIEYHVGIKKSLCRLGYRAPNVQKGTYLVRIDREDGALLDSFTSKCRRDVRKGLREGVEITRLTAPEDLEFFRRTHLEMCQRKGLSSLTPSEYDSFGPMYQRGYAMLFAAWYKGKVCNMALVDGLGIPRYWLGAATPAAFERGVPPTGQPLHFGIMRWFRERGVRYYDLGYSPGPVPHEGHPNYTVWRFKYEFAGDYVSLLPRYRRATSVMGRLLVAAARRCGKLRVEGMAMPRGGE